MGVAALSKYTDGVAVFTLGGEPATFAQRLPFSVSERVPNRKRDRDRILVYKLYESLNLLPFCFPLPSQGLGKVASCFGLQTTPSLVSIPCPVV